MKPWQYLITGLACELFAYLIGRYAIPFFWSHQSSSAFEFTIFLSIVCAVLFFTGWYNFGMAAERK